MSIVPITHLLLQCCSIGDREAEMLARWKDLKSSLKVLNLYGNTITHKGMESIAVKKYCLTCTGAVNISKVLRINKTLKYLNISDNPVGDDGISVISDGRMTIQH